MWAVIDAHAGAEIQPVWPQTRKKFQEQGKGSGLAFGQGKGSGLAFCQGTWAKGKT
jgi:hypothetical protein